MLETVIRPATVGDVSFVLSSAKRSEAGAQLNPDWLALNARWEEILQRNATCLVACSPLDPNVILGHVVYSLIADGLVVWACYVKQPYRRMKVASRLLREALQMSTGERMLFCSAVRPGLSDKLAEFGFERVTPTQALRMTRQEAA